MIEPKNHLKNLKRTREKESSRLFKHRLDRNERNQPFSERFMNNIRDKISGELFMVYPELDNVYEKMARWLNIDSRKVLLHSSSEQAIKSVFETFARKGDRVLLHFPGFAMYEVYCRMFEAEIAAQHYDRKLNFDWDEFLGKISKDVRMVVVENPNGFLGIAPSLDILRRIAERALRVGAILLVDEAYYHFHEETAVGWIGEYDNLIVVRTFSKAFGLAGLRAGYLVSQPENIAELNKVRPAYELNSVACVLISELLDNFGEVDSYLNDTRNNIKALKKGFEELGIATSDSKANFVAARLGGKNIHDKLRQALKEKHNILIRRPFREEHLKEWVRISTAPPEIQRILLGELKDVLSR